MDNYGPVQAHVAGLLDRIDRRLDAAEKQVSILNAASTANERGRLLGEYDKIVEAVRGDLDYLKRSFTPKGPFESRVSLITEKASHVLRLIIKSVGLDPDTPGLSERAELKQAVTLSRSKAQDVKKALDGFQKMKGKIGAGADLVLALTILAEVGAVLLRKIRSSGK